MRISKLTPETSAQILERARVIRTGLSSWVADTFEVTRRTASLWLKHMVMDGLLTASGTTHKTYAVSALADITFSVPVTGLDENQIWLERVAPWMVNERENVRTISQYGFTEMVNNVRDHSNGTTLTIHLSINATRIGMVILDDGMGIFRKVQQALDLPDPRLSLLELAKGRFTTDPNNHSGEGIFFTSRAFDTFAIHADGLRFSHSKKIETDSLVEADEHTRGTFVVMRIEKASDRILSNLFRQFAAPDEYTFDRTIVPMRMARLGDENLISRSQAKRVILRFDRFRFIELDFTDVPMIGQAFADEIFRVYSNAHPEITITASHCAADVDMMIRRAQAPR
jgi:anti-sigma regulatory factor (Ser/Thr protein kinase)